MSQLIICPQCGVPTVGTDGPSSTSGDAVCPQCGESLLRDVPAAPRITTVLCIDDDPLVLSFYRDFLDRHAYRVLTATDGLLGIELARRERPDVILLDVMLRGLSGYDICRKFRADPALHTVPIILITVWDNASVATTGQAAGATRTLQKPTDAETLLEVLAEVLGQQSGPSRG